MYKTKNSLQRGILFLCGASFYTLASFANESTTSVANENKTVRKNTATERGLPLEDEELKVQGEIVPPKNQLDRSTIEGRVIKNYLKKDTKLTPMTGNQ